MTTATIDISHAIRKRFNVSKFEIFKHEDELGRHMIYEFTACFAGKHQDPWIFKEPSSWWQHFKKSHFPNWLKKRFPVKEKETKLDVTLLYPHLKTNLDLGRLGQSITLMVKDSQGWCKFLNADPLSPIEPMVQMQNAADKPFYNPDDRRCPTCGKVIYID